MNIEPKYIAIGGGVLVLLVIVSRSSGSSSSASGHTLQSLATASMQDTALGAKSIDATVERERSSRESRTDQLAILSQAVQARIMANQVQADSHNNLLMNMMSNDAQVRIAKLDQQEKIINGKAMYSAMAKAAKLEHDRSIEMVKVQSETAIATQKLMNKQAESESEKGLWGTVVNAAGSIVSALIG